MRCKSKGKKEKKGFWMQCRTIAAGNASSSTVDINMPEHVKAVIN